MLYHITLVNENNVCNIQGVIDTKIYIIHQIIISKVHYTHSIYYDIHTSYYQGKIIIHKIFETFSKQMRLTGEK